MSDPDPPVPGPGDEERGFEGFEGWLAPFFRDSTLWPVLAVAVLIFGVLAAAALLMALVERNLFALGAVLAAFWISVDASLRARRRARGSPVPWLVAGFWGLAGAGALGALRAGWF